MSFSDIATQVNTNSKLTLTVNAGSSSLKVVVFLADSLERQLEVDITNIGQASGVLTLSSPEDSHSSRSLSIPNHREAARDALSAIGEKYPKADFIAIGYRIVHGGNSFQEPVIITKDVIAQLHTITVLDPEHMPVVLQLVDAFGEHFPDTPQIACFDTAFYRDLPKIAQLLPIPRKFEKLGVRRYGFHGLSYESLTESFESAAGKKAAQGRVIFAHLGSGASLTAMKNQKVLDTTMSFTPASGVPMSTRSGDLDPGIIEFLHRQSDMDIETFDHMVHFESGLLGVSELSPDMLLLIQNAGNNPQAADAVNLFCYQVKKAIGSLAAVLNGLDSLVFSGGIGENAPLIRKNICSGLDYLGLKLDLQRNDHGEFLISEEESRVGVHVIHTDEAAIIAKQIKQIVNRKAEAE